MKRSHLLRAEKAENLLVSLVNCRVLEYQRQYSMELNNDTGNLPFDTRESGYPYRDFTRSGREPDATGNPPEPRPASLTRVTIETEAGQTVTRLRAITKNYWPDLWGWIDESPQGAYRAVAILAKVRWYLRKFWSSTDTNERDWYIHRLRELHYRHLIQQKSVVQQLRLDAANNPELYPRLNVEIERALDEPPANTGFSAALTHLQNHLAPRALVCARKDDCDSPQKYFIRKRQGQRYCTERCAQIAHRNDNRAWAAARRAAAKKGKQS